MENGNNHGGSRPGAGRKPLFATKLREAIIAVAEKNAEELAEALYSKAVGKSDSMVDVPAMKELFDRGLGKALQNIDMTSNGESLNERITKLDDAQLEQLIASLGGIGPTSQGGTSGTALGEAEENQGESAEVREGA